MNICMKYHHMELATVPYKNIASGKKVIGSRLYDEKRQQISIGDTIEFSENDKPENVVRATVTDLFRYKTFTELFADHEPSLFGDESRDFLLSQIKQFYSEEDEMRYGVVGIRLQVER